MCFCTRPSKQQSFNRLKKEPSGSSSSIAPQRRLPPRKCLIRMIRRKQPQQRQNASSRSFGMPVLPTTPSLCRLNGRPFRQKPGKRHRSSCLITVGSRKSSVTFPSHLRTLKLHSISAAVCPISARVPQFSARPPCRLAAKAPTA